jgi:hypothetical protein
MVSWKSFFEMNDKELKVLRRKKEVLDSLLNENRISEFTYDSLNQEINGAIDEVENRQKMLDDRMTLKVGELEERLKALEKLLANLEISYHTGELDEEFYGSESVALSLKMEAVKAELSTITDALSELTPEETTDVS